jgi:predicted nucleic acid-binding protein
VLKLLDSTVLIDFLRGRPAVARLARMREVGDLPGTTPINVEEIFRGLLPHEMTAADRLVTGLVVVPIDERVGRRAGRWRREYVARGITLAQADCLIAACALQSHATLVTGNPKDFPMTEVTVEHWPVGT